MVINVSIENLYWIAALLEGEGSFSLNGPYSPVIALQMTDKDIIYRAALILGGDGTVREADNRGIDNRGINRNKLTYRFNTYGCHAIEWMKLILPIMGERRSARINEILIIWESRPVNGEFRTQCRKGHELEPDNYIIDDNNIKQCKICRKERAKKNYKLRNTPEYILAKARNISIDEAKELMEKAFKGLEN